VEAMTPKLSTEPRIRDFVKLLISHQQPIGVSNALNAMAGRFDSTEWFTTFKFPTVIVHGDADMLIPINRGREMKAALPSAEYFELAGLGHMAMMENPRTVADAFPFFCKIIIQKIIIVPEKKRTEMGLFLPYGDIGLVEGCKLAFFCGSESNTPVRLVSLLRWATSTGLGTGLTR